MALIIRHTFVSEKPDINDTTIVRPSDWNATHSMTGSVEETMIDFSDVTTGNATTGRHGLLKKLPGTATLFLNGTGNWTTPAGGGGGGASPWVEDPAGTIFFTSSSATRLVGINTPIPAFPLDVAASVQGTYGFINARLASPSSEAGLQIENNGTGGRTYSIISTNNNSGIGGGKFVIADGTAGEPRITILPNGIIDFPGNITGSGSMYICYHANNPIAITGKGYANSTGGVGIGIKGIASVGAGAAASELIAIVAGSPILQALGDAVAIAIGLKVEDITEGLIDNYAIKTGVGKVYFGAGVEAVQEIKAGTFISSSVITVASSATPTFVFSQGNTFKYQMTGNTVPIFESPSSGQRITLIIGQPGNHLWTWPMGVFNTKPVNLGAGTQTFELMYDGSFYTVISMADSKPNLGTVANITSGTNVTFNCATANIFTFTTNGDMNLSVTNPIDGSNVVFMFTIGTSGAFVDVHNRLRGAMQFTAGSVGTKHIQEFVTIDGLLYATGAGRTYASRIDTQLGSSSIRNTTTRNQNGRAGISSTMMAPTNVVIFPDNIVEAGTLTTIAVSFSSSVDISQSVDLDSIYVLASIPGAPVATFNYELIFGSEVHFTTTPSAFNNGSGVTFTSLVVPFGSTMTFINGLSIVGPVTFDLSSYTGTLTIMIP